MTTFEAALTAWIAFHSELGVNIEATFMPPTTETELVAAEQTLGFALPEDLRSLYKVTNGQYDPYDSKTVTAEHLGPNEYWAPLFGYYRLIPLDQAISWHLDIIKDYENVKKDHEENPGQEYETWDVREGDPVDPRQYTNSRFTFAVSDADQIAIDMNPPRGGSPGQVVEFGSDVTRISVLGSSLTDLMEVASYRLSLDETNRYERNEPDNDYVGTVYFNMDWRNKPYDEQAHLDSMPAFPEEYQQWTEDQNEKIEQRAQRFVDWLKRRGLDESDVANVANMQSGELDYVSDFEPMPDHVAQAMNAWSIARGEEPTLYAPQTADADESMHNVVWTRYLMGLASEALSSKDEDTEYASNDMGRGLLREDAIKLIHKYYLESGAWSPQQFKSATAFLDSIAKLNIVKVGEAGSHSMEVDNTILKICYFTFDSKTNKMANHCDKVDLDNYRKY